MLQVPRLGPHGSGMCHPSKNFKPVGGTKGMWPNPPLALTTTANSRPPAFPSWPQTNHNESSSKERMARGHSCSFPQPWPHCSLSWTFYWSPSDSGWAGNECALIDSCAQVSSITSHFCEDLALQSQPLDQLLDLEGTGGSAIPYLWFVEVSIQILGVKN